MYIGTDGKELDESAIYRNSYKYVESFNPIVFTIENELITLTLITDNTQPCFEVLSIQGKDIDFYKISQIRDNIFEKCHAVCDRVTRDKITFISTLRASSLDYYTFLMRSNLILTKYIILKEREEYEGDYIE